MGEAKRRGSYDERRKAAMAKAIVKEAENLEPKPDTQRYRVSPREMLYIQIALMQAEMFRMRRF